MTKSELIEAIVNKHPNISKKNIEFIINSVFNSIKDSLQKGEKVEIRGYALGSEEGLFEAEPSSSLLIPGFSVFPDFVVFPASWSGADASHIPALNTSSTSALHCFRTFSQQEGSPTNTDFTLEICDGRWYSVLCRAKARKINSGESFPRKYLQDRSYRGRAPKV